MSCPACRPAARYGLLTIHWHLDRLQPSQVGPLNGSPYEGERKEWNGFESDATSRHRGGDGDGLGSCSRDDVDDDESGELFGLFFGSIYMILSMD